MNKENYEDTEVQSVPSAQRSVHVGGNFGTPIAIILGALLIAGAVVFNGQLNKVPQGAAVLPTGQDQQKENLGTVAAANMKPIDENDHIRGNPAAQVVIVEYSDFECPFCKKLHPTLQQVMEEYGAKGQVAWVYRHFPLDSLHPVKARAEAVAAECAAELGGNDGFWEFTDRMYLASETNNRTDIATVLPAIAKEMGLDADVFASCLTSGKFDDKIEASVQDGIATGGNGTPWNIVLTKSGKILPVSGAQPYAVFKQIIDAELAQ